jgi:hypothetical protein
MNDYLNKQEVKLSNFFFFITASVLGFISISLPPYFTAHGKSVIYDAPLFPILATAIKNLSILPTVVLLIISGFIMGYLKPRIWWLLGLATVMLFPAAAICEMVLYPTTHNLWPVELLVYGMLSIPSMLGALVGSKLRDGKNA